MKKGKNFSCNNTGKRKNSDFYETPYSMIQQLLENFKFFDNEVFEPCCGNGAIVKILEKNGYKVAADDLLNGYDFLKEEKWKNLIITNPPFSLAEEFIKKAKLLTYQFAFLLPLSYLHGESRLKIYKDEIFPLRKVYVFTRYPMLGDDLREDGKYRTGMMVYAWFIWEKFYTGKPSIDWISNQNYILSKKDK